MDSRSSAIVASSPSRQEIELYCLVLEARRISCLITSSHDGLYHLVVAPNDLGRAQAELDAYIQENSNWPPAVPRVTTVPGSWEPTVFIIGSLLILYAITGEWRQDSLWFDRGAGDAQAILDDGEWYRLLTSLTLHADLSHLIGNCIVGGFVLYHYLGLVGYGVGSFAVLTSAVAATLANIILRGGNHYFVGFSTAVFATIGLLAAYQIVNRRKILSPGAVAPLLAALALLGMLGGSGVRTDLGAHLFGLLAGIGGGGIVAFATRKGIAPAMQPLLLLTTIFIVAIGWIVALN